MVDRKMTPATQEAVCHHLSRPARVRNASRQTQTRNDLPAGSTMSGDQRASAVSFPVAAQRGASANSFATFASFAVPQGFAQESKTPVVSSTEKEKVTANERKFTRMPAGRGRMPALTSGKETWGRKMVGRKIADQTQAYFCDFVCGQR